MMQDYQDVQRCTRRCAATDRELAAGETYYSVLQVQGAQVQRLDYCEQGWQGPPENALGWWKAALPAPNHQAVQWAPDQVVLQYFEQLADHPQQADQRYVLALLLVRRRILRLDRQEKNTAGQTVLCLVHPDADQEYHVLEVEPEAERLAAIQASLQQLLFSGGG